MLRCMNQLGVSRTFPGASAWYFYMCSFQACIELRRKYIYWAHAGSKSSCAILKYFPVASYRKIKQQTMINPE